MPLPYFTKEELEIMVEAVRHLSSSYRNNWAMYDNAWDASKKLLHSNKYDVLVQKLIKLSGQ